jgi:glycosyltransferase involved in cell wall biosynthesis
LGEKNVSLINFDLLNFLKTSEKKFNFILCLNSLHNLKNREEIKLALNDAQRLAQPGGYFIFDIRNKFNPFVRRGYKKNLKNGYQFFTFSYLKALNILRKQGWDIIKIVPIRYQTLKQAGKENLPIIKRAAYWLYLRLSASPLLAPYILIYAQKKPNKFISIIWGYHAQLAKLSPIENYHLHDLKLAQSLGYETEAFLIAPNVKIESDPNFSSLNVKISYYKNPWQYIKWLFKNRHAVIYANTFIWQSLVVPLFAQKSIFMGHDSVCRKNKYKQILQNISFYLFSRLRVISPDEKDFLIEQVVKETKINIVPLTLDIDRFSIENTDRQNLAFLGNVYWDKNINDVLIALTIVQEKYPNVKLEIFGEIRDPKFESLVAELNLKNNIIVHGFVPHSELPAHLAKTLIYVNSSISEGQCLAVYEASLAGNALCLPNTLSFRSLFKNRALFHELFDHETLSKNILSYLDNPELRKKHITDSQKFIKENYNPDIIAQKTKKLFLYE